MCWYVDFFHDSARGHIMMIDTQKSNLTMTRLYDNHGNYQLLKAFVKQQCLFFHCVEQSLRVGEDEIEFPNLHIFNWVL